MTHGIGGGESADGVSGAVRASVGLASFDEFYRTNRPKILRGLALALHDVDLANDATNEAFARAWQRWGTVSQMTNPSGWVYRVGLNWARSFLRRFRREVHTPHHDLGHSLIEDPVVDPSLAAALAQLSTDHRAVLVAKFYLDWSEAEIASALGIAAGTVKSRLSRSLDKLAETVVRSTADSDTTTTGTTTTGTTTTDTPK